MNNKTTKGSFHNLNPYDLGSVARVTQAPPRTVFGSTRSSDINSVGGKNSTVSEKGSAIRKDKK